MINAFISAVREYVRDDGCRPVVLGAYESQAFVLYYAVNPKRQYAIDYICRVHEDGSAQLLSRDEDECLLFATLWELEK